MGYTVMGQGFLSWGESGGDRIPRKLRGGCGVRCRIHYVASPNQMSNSPEHGQQHQDEQLSSDGPEEGISHVVSV
jgi:hypothetical protein